MTAELGFAFCLEQRFLSSPSYFNWFQLSPTLLSSW